MLHKIYSLTNGSSSLCHTLLLPRPCDGVGPHYDSVRGLGPQSCQCVSGTDICGVHPPHLHASLQLVTDFICSDDPFGQEGSRPGVLERGGVGGRQKKNYWTWP